MANVLPTTSIIAKEALAILKNSPGFAQAVNRDYEAEFTGSMSRGYPPGATINIKKPPRYTWRAGRVFAPQDTTYPTVPLTLSQGGVDPAAFTSLERTVSIARFEDVMQSAMATVVTQIDMVGLALADRAAFNTIPSIGAPPTTQALAYAAVAAVGQRLDEMSAPRDGRRSFALSPSGNGALIQGFGGLFNDADRIGKQYKTGIMENLLGINPFMDQNIPIHVSGTQPASATNAVNGAGQTGATITVNTAAITGTLNVGDVIQFAGVNAVNPVNRLDTGSLADFVVTAPVASGGTSISISPAIVVTGPFQNVTASPANNATLTKRGTAGQSYTSNIAFHRDAFTLAMVPMDTPDPGTGAKVTQMSDEGFTVKVTKFYDGVNDCNATRLDVLFGYAATYPELAVKYIV